MYNRVTDIGGRFIDLLFIVLAMSSLTLHLPNGEPQHFMGAAPEVWAWRGLALAWVAVGWAAVKVSAAEQRPRMARRGR